MAGREQKAKEGKWNGGFAPYGYKLVNNELLIAEEEQKRKSEPRIVWRSRWTVLMLWINIMTEKF